MLPRSLRPALFVLVTCVALAAPRAWAGILDNGPYTRDVETGLEYLDLSVTRGRFAMDFVTWGTWQSHTHPGFRLATEAEGLSLLAAVGIAPDVYLSLAYYAPVTTLQTFLGGAVPGNATNSFGTLIPLTRNASTPVSGSLTGYNLWAGHTQFAGGVWQVGGAWNQAGATAGVLLVRNYVHGTTADALAASFLGSGQAGFTGAPGDGIWFDLSSLRGTDFTVQGQGGARVTHVGVGSDFTDADGQLTILDPISGEVVLGAGDLYELSEPVESLLVSGVSDPAVSALLARSAAAGEGALPLLLRFDAPEVDFVATVVPEPGTLVLLGGGLAALAGAMRRAERGPGAE